MVQGWERQASAPRPTFAVRLRRALTRTSEAKGYWQVVVSRAAFRLEGPGREPLQAGQDLQIGGTMHAAGADGDRSADQVRCSFAEGPDDPAPGARFRHDLTTCSGRPRERAAAMSPMPAVGRAWCPAPSAPVAGEIVPCAFRSGQEHRRRPVHKAPQPCRKRRPLDGVHGEPDLTSAVPIPRCFRGRVGGRAGCPNAAQPENTNRQRLLSYGARPEMARTVAERPQVRSIAGPQLSSD
jgi:hypothetical protein